MAINKRFSDQVDGGDFIVTAEFLPRAETDGTALKKAVESLKSVPSAVNVSDNPFSPVMSSLAASIYLLQAGLEPIYHVVTRDRNRIAIQSDLLGAAFLGIKNMLCLSGYHQALTDNPESANVYDIDSTQLLGMIKKMREKGELLNGNKISGPFSIITGAVANPNLTPIELNLLRLSQKVEAGATFIQTHAIFDVDKFRQWFEAAGSAGILKKAVVLAGVFPLESAAEADELRKKYTEFQIPENIVQIISSAGDSKSQKKAGREICVEIIDKLKGIKGLRGIHILSGGKEEDVPEILKAAGLSAKN